MPDSKGPGAKARLARMFLNFLDEHGDYRTQLEETAARAAAAEANSLLAQDRRNKKKKKRRGFKLTSSLDWRDDLDDEELYDDEIEPPPEPQRPQMPEDPYEQIQFYFRTFRHRTAEQITEQATEYKNLTVGWLHDELHHELHVPLLSAVFMMASLLVIFFRRRARKVAKVDRVHAILGKSWNFSDYFSSNIIKGRLLLQHSAEGLVRLMKMKAKADKAESAALASMRPYQRKRYERLSRLEFLGELSITAVLLVGFIVSGVTLGMSLNRLHKNGAINLTKLGLGSTFNTTFKNDTTSGSIPGVEMLDGVDTALDGHIYSTEDEVDADGYPINVKDDAEERYAACLFEAEESGVTDTTAACDANVFFGIANDGNIKDGLSEIQQQPMSPLRARVEHFLTHKLHFPEAIASYLATLQGQTIAYLSSLFTFILFLVSHYMSHKIHIAMLANDPMKHFVVVDKTVKADGTVEAKRGETEAQRKKRERILQNERLKAQMAQLAMEAKQRVHERRMRMEGKAALEKEQDEVNNEVDKKQAEEQEEIVKLHSRQFNMMKVGVPEGAILNSFSAEGIEEEEAKEIFEKLKAVKARRAEETRRREEAEKKQAELVKKRNEEKEIIAKEKARLADQQLRGSKGSKVKRMSSEGVPMSKVNCDKKQFARSSSTGASTHSAGASSLARSNSVGGSSFIKSNSSLGGTSKSSASTDASAAKANMLSMIGNGALKPASERKLKKRPDKKPGTNNLSTKAVSGNLPISSRSDKRWDRDNKTLIEAENSPRAARGATPGRNSVVSRDHQSQDPTPKKSNAKGEVEQRKDDIGPLPPSLPLSTPTSDTTSKRRGVPAQEKSFADNTSESSQPPVLVRISQSSDADTPPSPSPPLLTITPTNSSDAWARPSAQDIKSQIEVVESTPDELLEDRQGKLSPNWAHTPAFENAMRASNASWAHRPSSRDVIAKIKAVEQSEAEEIELRARMAALSKSRGSLAIIDERRKIEPATYEVQRKNMQSNCDDDDISALSEPTYISLDQSAGRSVPSALFVPEGNKVPMSPMISPTNSSRNLLTSQDVNIGSAALPDVTPITEEKPHQSKSSASVKSENSSSSANKPREPTDEEKSRKKRANARAKKLEAMTKARQRKTNKDDDTAVSGISKRHRLRRKKSALAAIKPEEKERNDWKKSIYSFVLSAEQTKWRKDIYTHVLSSEDTKAKNEAARLELKEQEAQAKRRRENQKRHDEKAKKFAARAARFHKIRREGGGDDDEASVVSKASRMRRRRGRKSTKGRIKPVEETPVIEPQPADEGKLWRDSIYSKVLKAEQEHWKRNIFCHVLDAERTLAKNSELQTQLARDQAAVLARKEKERKNRARELKMARIMSMRDAAGNDVENNFNDDVSVVSTTSQSTSGGSMLKKMRSRRRAAMRKNATK